MNPRTFIAFGDSTTAPRGPLVIYADHLRQQFPHDRVLNAGVGGSHTDQARSRFEQDVLAHRPDLVIIQFGINDAAVDVWMDPPATEPRIPLDRFEDNLGYFLDRLRDAGASALLATPNPLTWTPQSKARYGKPPCDPDDPDGFNLVLKRYVAAVRRLAEARGASLVDVEAAFRDFGAQAGQSIDNLLLDGMHPNDAGHEIVAGLLLDAIQRVT